jgi:ABC-2 type transport system permease protein
MTPVAIGRSIASVAKKEFLHILRDWRVLVLILTLPPAFTLLFGHAFAESAITQAPALLRDADHSDASRKLIEKLRQSKTFSWQVRDVEATPPVDRLRRHFSIDVVIPPKWGQSLKDGDPKPLQLTLDGTDANTAPELRGAIQETLGDFQLDSRQGMIDDLPDEVFELGKKIPEAVRKEFTSAMSPWTVESKILYNPDLRFIDFVMPGIVGLILQLLTVTLTACTIARERESGTLAQLLVSPLSRNQIVAGPLPFRCPLSLACLDRAPLSALPPVLSRYRIAHLRFLPHPVAGHPVRRLLSAAGLPVIGSLCLARAASAQHPIGRASLPAHPFLPCLSPREPVPGQRFDHRS